MTTTQSLRPGLEPLAGEGEATARAQAFRDAQLRESVKMEDVDMGMLISTCAGLASTGLPASTWRTATRVRRSPENAAPSMDGSAVSAR